MFRSRGKRIQNSQIILQKQLAQTGIDLGLAMVCKDLSKEANDFYLKYELLKMADEYIKPSLMVPDLDVNHDAKLDLLNVYEDILNLLNDNDQEGAILEINEGFDLYSKKMKNLLDSMPLKEAEQAPYLDDRGMIVLGLLFSHHAVYQKSLGVHHLKNSECSYAITAFNNTIQFLNNQYALYVYYNKGTCGIDVCLTAIQNEIDNVQMVINLTQSYFEEQQRLDNENLARVRQLSGFADDDSSEDELSNDMLVDVSNDEEIEEFNSETTTSNIESPTTPVSTLTIFSRSRSGSIENSNDRDTVSPVGMSQR